MTIELSRLSRDYNNNALKYGEIPTKEDLEYLYNELGLTTVEIAKFFNKGDSTVSRWLIKLNISRSYKPTYECPLTAAELASVDLSRMSRDFQKEPWKPRRDKAVKSDFEYLYIELNWTQENLSEYFGLSTAQVVHTLADLGISKTTEQHQASRERANLRKYGTKHTIAMKETREKIESTNLSKYGCKSTLSSAEVKEKCYETMQEKYGVSHALQSKEFIDKMKTTNLHRYGTGNPNTFNNIKVDKKYKEDYATEQNILDLLETLFPDAEWKHNKQLAGTTYRPDYCSQREKLIIEFDGYTHYTSAEAALRDIEKDNIYSTLGYKVIRIPYFVQLSTVTINILFGKNINYTQTYPHGFISSKHTAVLPANFCELGIQRFMRDLEKFHLIKQDIIDSLKAKVDLLGSKYLVLPPSLILLQLI